MAQVVVLGGSFAGLTGAVRLRKLLPKAHRIVLVSESDRFVFRPSLPWVALGNRRPEEITAGIRRVLEPRGIEFVQDVVEGIDLTSQAVHLKGGLLEYDYLLVALGARLDYRAVTGLREYGHSVLWLDDAVKTARALASFEGGAAVIGIARGSPLVCPAYEMVLQLEAYLQRRGIRRKCSIHFVTSEQRPYGIGGGKAAEVVEGMFRQYDIAFHPLRTPVEVQPRRVVLDDGTELPSEFTLFMPPYVGTEPVRQAAGLADDQGFVPCGRDMRSTLFQNVFVAGDAVAFAGPKTGRMAELQAEVAAGNIAAEIRGQPAGHQYRSELLCLSDLGHGTGLLVLAKPAPGQGPSNTIVTLPGHIAHWMKVLFEKYYLTLRL